jgi:nicotinate-nucleotide adenylyltransferase
MKLGVLGGTFDPVHIGHLVLAERAREQLGLDRVLWVPAGDPWRKRSRRISPASHRLKMVQLAIDGHPAFEVSTIELQREGPTYSADTLEQLHQKQPGAALFFILGYDALIDLPNWHDPHRIVSVATLVVAQRAGEQRLSRAELRELLPGLPGRVVWVDMPRLDVSGTELRARVRAGKSVRYLVPDAVAAYIEEHGLYR